MCGIGDSAADDQAQVRAQFYYPFAQVPDRLLRALVGADVDRGAHGRARR